MVKKSGFVTSAEKPLINSPGKEVNHGTSEREIC